SLIHLGVPLLFGLLLLGWSLILAPNYSDRWGALRRAYSFARFNFAPRLSFASAGFPFFSIFSDICPPSMVERSLRGTVGMVPVCMPVRCSQISRRSTFARK